MACLVPQVPPVIYLWICTHVPPGCGKTTLLKCILGQIQGFSGEICLFGGQAGASSGFNLSIPGRDVGYMPQELGLDLELTSVLHDCVVLAVF